MDDELIERARAATAVCFPEHDVLVAYAHGSRVSGRPRADSDLDVGYYLRGFREGRRLPLKTELLLEDRLSRELGVEVDLRGLADAPLEVRGKVLEQGVRIYSGHDAERVDLEVDLLARYHDYKPELEYLARLRLRRIAEHGLR